MAPTRELLHLKDTSREIILGGNTPTTELREVLLESVDKESISGLRPRVRHSSGTESLAAAAARTRVRSPKGL